MVGQNQSSLAKARAGRQVVSGKGRRARVYRQNLCKNKVLVKLFKVLFSKIIKIPIKTQKQSRSLSKLIR